MESAAVVIEFKHVAPQLLLAESQEGSSGNEFSTSSRSNSPVDENDGSFKNSKVCGVCGDKALGNNFNAITCESCKAFFRRNALKQKKFVCPFNDTCKVDSITRRFCQKCRLKKCFEIGMKKEWIMTDEEKKLKKKKIELNRVKRQSSDAPLDPPPAKIPCLSAQNSNFETANVTNIPAQTEDSYPGSVVHPSKQLPTSLAVTTIYDQIATEDVPRLTQYITPNIDNSPSCSNSSLEDNFTPNATLMTSLHQSQSQPTQLANKSLHSSQIQNGNLKHHEMESPSSMHVLPASVQRSVHIEPQEPYQWQDEGLTYFPRHYPLANSLIYGNQTERDSATKSAQHSSPHVGSQDKPPTQSYQMPLLSSLIRPREPESPPEDNLSIHNQLPQNNLYGVPYGHERMKQVLPSLSVEQHQVGSSGIRPPPSHHYASCHATNQYRILEVEEDIPPPLPLNTMDSILSVAIRAEFNSFGMMSKPQDYMSKELNAAETAKLQELLIACKALGDPVDQELSGPIKIKNSDPTLINVINLTDIAIRRLIKMSKKITGFKNMCQEDQIALLKGGCTEMMILRSVVTYDPDRDSWNIPHSYGYNIKLGVLKEARGNLYEEHQRFVKSFKPEWRSDENIMILLCAITLFTAERPNVIHKDVVKLEQDSYYYLLKRYLESIVNGCESRSTYLLLIRKIAELRILNSNHLRVFLEVNPREVEPLLREVFSMV